MRYQFPMTQLTCFSLTIITLHISLITLCHNSQVTTLELSTWVCVWVSRLSAVCLQSQSAGTRAPLRMLRRSFWRPRSRGRSGDGDTTRLPRDKMGHIIMNMRHSVMSCTICIYCLQMQILTQGFLVTVCGSKVRTAARISLFRD